MPYLMREKMFPRYYFLGITIIAGDRSTAQHTTINGRKSMSSKVRVAHTEKIKMEGDDTQISQARNRKAVLQLYSIRRTNSDDMIQVAHTIVAISLGYTEIKTP